MLLVWVLLTDRGPVAGMFSTRGFLYWGRVSYSLYMVQATVISCCHFLLPVGRFAGSPLVVKLAVMGGYIVALGCGGALAFHYVEEPCRLRMRRVLGGE